MFTVQLIICVVGTLVIVWISRASFRDLQGHGFTRFVAWEIILILFCVNVRYWIKDPLSLRQLISWTLLIISLILIIHAVRLFHQKGRIDPGRSDPTLVGIEKTTTLVTMGIYHYIRHPFYSSLLFLTWGVFFKQITLLMLGLAITATIFLWVTAKREEGENIQYFGEAYREYMQNTKMLIPYIL